ncbi:hypothetical protein ABG067_008599, partial [Albugo candida]
MIIKAILGFLLLFISLVSCQDEDPYQTEEDEAAIVESVMFAPLPTPVLRNFIMTPEYNSNNEPKVICHNYRTEFYKNMRGWQVENSMQDTYDIDQTGIKLNLVPPKEYVRLHDQV